MRIPQRYLRPFSRRETVTAIAGSTVTIPMTGFVCRAAICGMSHQNFGMIQMIQWWHELGLTLGLMGFVSTSLCMSLLFLLRRAQQGRS